MYMQNSIWFVYVILIKFLNIILEMKMVILPVYDTIYSDLTPKGLLKMTIRRNWQHKTKKNKTKAQHNMHNQRQTT